jgi:hypothetical protein
MDQLLDFKTAWLCFLLPSSFAARGLLLADMLRNHLTMAGQSCTVAAGRFMQEAGGMRAVLRAVATPCKVCSCCCKRVPLGLGQAHSCPTLS